MTFDKTEQRIFDAISGLSPRVLKAATTIAPLFRGDRGPDTCGLRHITAAVNLFEKMKPPGDYMPDQVARVLGLFEAAKLGTLLSPKPIPVKLYDWEKEAHKDQGVFVLEPSYYVTPNLLLYLFNRARPYLVIEGMDEKERSEPMLLYGTTADTLAAEVKSAEITIGNDAFSAPERAVITLFKRKPEQTFEVSLISNTDTPNEAPETRIDLGESPPTVQYLDASMPASGSPQNFWY